MMSTLSANDAKLPRLRAVSEPAPSPGDDSTSNAELYEGLSDGSEELPSVVFGPEASSNALEEEKPAEEPLVDSPEPVSPSITEAPDGGYGWVVVYGCCMAHILMGGLNRSYSAIYVQVRQHFESSAAVSAAIGGTAISIRFLGAPVGSLVSNRFSARCSIMCGGVILLTSCVLSSLATTDQVLLFTYGVLSGIGGAFVLTPGLVLVGQYFTSHRALALATSAAGTGIGMFALPPLINALFLSYGNFGAWLLLGAIMFHVTACGALHRPLGLTPRKSHRTWRTFISRNYDSHFPRYSLKDNSNKHCYHPSSQHICDSERSSIHMDNGAVNLGVKYNTLPQPNTDPGVLSSSDEEKELGTSSENPRRRLRRKPLSRSVPRNHKYLGAERGESIASIRKEETQPCNGNGYTRPIEHRKQRAARTCTQYLDFSLFYDGIFLSFALCQLLATCGQCVCDIMLVDMTLSQGLEINQSILLVSVVGISDFIGRITSGFVFDSSYLLAYRYSIFSVCLLVIAFSLLVVSHCSAFISTLAVLILYGVCVGGTTAQRVTIIAHLFGVESLTSSLGFINIFMGFGYLTAPYLAGYLRDITGAYKSSFTLAGVSAGLSALFFLLCVRLKHRRAIEPAEKLTDAEA